MRGSVVRVRLPPPRRIRKGEEPSHVQAGPRPAVILHSPDSLDDIPTTLIVPGTGKLKALRFPHTVRVEPSDDNGLVVPTVFLAFQLMPVDDRIIDDPPLGRLSEEELELLEEAVFSVLGLGGEE